MAGLRRRLSLTEGVWKGSDGEAGREDEASSRAMGIGTVLQEMEPPPSDRLDVGGEGAGGVIQLPGAVAHLGEGRRGGQLAPPRTTHHCTPASSS